eukprot:CAMPEP_0114541066 /NCGR_PEP_ID=MMETSP0114-20121206/1105_1 /TAXON_ID=31324 /ORGANISM="Goniomonas sp, Strain m" /LENGTH=90 /DNA_ID=CAMNT_0001725275 /DNA_START=18 /DNA_END=290 /DNA_ORIENTATION=+
MSAVKGGARVLSRAVVNASKGKLPKRSGDHGHGEHGHGEPFPSPRLGGKTYYFPVDSKGVVAFWSAFVVLGGIAVPTFAFELQQWKFNRG